ncbi:hypothetical protein B0H12DRAFT_1147494 [Mycena haematopus]|nr:hypothetical protein B0H12DRAFT_1147494 [Mycena haematopus]
MLSFTSAGIASSKSFVCLQISCTSCAERFAMCSHPFVFDLAFSLSSKTTRTADTADLRGGKAFVDASIVLRVTVEASEVILVERVRRILECMAKKLASSERKQKEEEEETPEGS